MIDWEPTHLTHEGGAIYRNRQNDALAYEPLQDAGWFSLRLVDLPCEVEAAVRVTLGGSRFQEAA